MPRPPKPFLAVGDEFLCTGPAIPPNEILERLAVDRRESFSYWLFFRKDSRRAGDALIEELRRRKKLTEPEMSQFAHRLDRGELGFRFSRTNFYRKVLRTFVDLGFIGKSLVPGENNKNIRVYKAIRQPITSHKPTPSFWSVAYDTCKWWNEMMFSEDKTEQDAGDGDEGSG